MVEVDHPVAGPVKTLGAPVKFHGTPVHGTRRGVKCAAPLLGQHSDEVLAEVGYDSEAIQTFVRAGVIGCSIKLA